MGLLRSPLWKKGTILAIFRHCGNTPSFRHSLYNVSSSGLTDQDIFLRKKWFMLWQSKLNFDGSTRSVSMISQLVIGKQNMIFVLVSISCFCFVSNAFASSTPMFAKKVLKCFYVFYYLFIVVIR